MGDSTNSGLVELWKYPVAVLAVFLALVGAKYILGVPFGSLSEVTKDGVKFTQDAKGEIASLSAQVNALSKAMEELKRRAPEGPLSAAARTDIFEASQTVSTQTAQLTSVDAAGAQAGPPQKGYIWIGDYDKKAKSWSRVKLIWGTSNARLESAPESITPGSVYAVSSNMVVRDGLPPNTAEYFQARKSLGVLPVGTKVIAQSQPVAVDREFAVQYWLEVAVQR